jgi:hypothetical protein
MAAVLSVVGEVRAVVAIQVTAQDRLVRFDVACIRIRLVQAGIAAAEH